MMGIALHIFLLQLILFLFASLAEANNPRKIYLVQMKVGGQRYGSSSGHQELLGEVLDNDSSSTIPNALIYSYKESFTGFSARLTHSERQKLKRRREVLQVSRSRNLKLHTTRSWDFMHLTLAAKRNPLNESNLVVAVIDSGIWPYSELFSSDSPPPLAWQNKCQNITCNNKIVGARSYYPDPEKEGYDWIEENSVIDVTGHGTHVASIVAGREIEKASYFGLAEGTMRGGVPNAKIAVYKTCWSVRKDGTDSSVCPQHKVLEAIEDAIKDEVHMISFSQGLTVPVPMDQDHVSWAFLRALGKGILTSTAAGNLGMSGGYYAISNGAPWVMTVAASVKDSLFETILELEGDEPIAVYNTINTFETQGSFYELLNETGSAELTRKRELVAESKDDSILYNHKNGKGKDVLFNLSQTLILEKAIKERAKGVIGLSNSNDSVGSKKFQYPIASIVLDKENGVLLQKYFAKNKSKHLVRIHKSVEISDEGMDPTVADMSSRGPNCDSFLANILKPDIAAPGLDIIAGWPENVKLVSQYAANDYRHLRFNILSGTSMACPHATGLALYIKSFKHWSPSAIKSALMTTSTEMIGIGDGFAYGSGQLNATKVLDPGLIYETKHQDYVNYMCKQGYNTEKLRSHVGSHEINCTGIKIDKNADLNYPSMSAQVKLKEKFSKVFYRTVTNVGNRNSTYIGKIKFRGKNNFKAKITVKPRWLNFSKLGQTKTFTVNVTGISEPNSKHSNETFMLGNTWLTWTEIGGSRQVRSPIVIYSIAKGTNACTKF